jgi:hypothetical protein
MALPITSAPLPPDIAIQGWAAITVRIAWTLVRSGVRVTRDVLFDARDHVLFHLDPATPLSVAEDIAEQLTREFVLRARHRKERDRWPQDAQMPLSPRWHKALAYGLPPVERALFRSHYGSGLTLQQLSEQLQVDEITLEGARGGIRELLRQMGCDDGMPLNTWPNERLDRLIGRLAAYSDEPTPPLDEVVDGCHQAMLDKCPRCERTWRLAQNGLITSDDLVPPGVIARPEQRVRLLALHFHPEGKAFRNTITRELEVPWFPVADDVLLIDLTEHERVNNILLLAAELGTPDREYLRGIVLEGLGRWSIHGLLGPLASNAYQTVRGTQWGFVETLGDLPATIPPPPASRNWWIAASVAGLLALGLFTAAFLQPTPDSLYPIEANVTLGANGAWAVYDVDDMALMTVVTRVGERLKLVLADKSAADKARYAVGDGSFRLQTPGNGVLLISSKEPVANLNGLLLKAQTQAFPFAKLAEYVRAQDPQADVQIFGP